MKVREWFSKSAPIRFVFSVFFVAIVSLRPPVSYLMLSA